MRTHGVIVVLGILGRTPFAGVAWQVLHYLEGLRRLGCDVYYIEDSGDWPYDVEQNTVTDECDYTVKHIARLMAWCGMSDRWAYRNRWGKNSRFYGLDETRVSELYRRADAIINLCASTELHDKQLRVPVRIYLESDPVLRQIQIANGDRYAIDFLGAHTHHFTFGENFGAPDCSVPIEQFEYHPTRQPIVIEWWRLEGDSKRIADSRIGNGRRYTTVSNWKQTGNDIEWNGQTYYWSKHLEFLKLIDLPRRAKWPFEIALASSDKAVVESLTSYGWSITDAVELTKDILPYRDYILGSGGEFTVAKDQNIRLRSGWFSDRSACYLAAGKPVITQDTGFGNVLPTGEGLFAFKTIEDILVAMDDVASGYDQHCQAARDIAEEYFSAEMVLGNLLDTI